MSADFEDYLRVQSLVDKEYKQPEKWYLKAVDTISKMGFFSSDKSVEDYAKNIWNLKKVDIQDPVNSLDQKRISKVSLKSN